MSRYSNPEYTATSLRHEYGVDNAKAVDFSILLPALNIIMREAPLPGGTLGACKVKGSHRLIVISTAIPDENQRRFTVAHETGHVILHHGTGFCSGDDIDMYFLGARTAVDKENDANKFASALLLPEATITDTLRLNDISFDMARKLANNYGASLTSTLIRLVKSSTDDVCIFLHSEGKIEFSFISPNCRLRPRSGILSPGALANRISDREPSVKGDTDYSDWFGENVFFDDSVCTEESRFFPRWQKTISIINVYSDHM